MMNRMPSNPPVGGYMPVNYCTFGEENREEGGKRKNRDEEHMKKTKRRKRRERQGER